MWCRPMRWDEGSVSVPSDLFWTAGGYRLSRERWWASGDSCSAFSQYVIHASSSSASLQEGGPRLCAKWRRSKCRLKSSSLSLPPSLKTTAFGTWSRVCRQLLWASWCRGNWSISSRRHRHCLTQRSEKQTRQIPSLLCFPPFESYF